MITNYPGQVARTNYSGRVAAAGYAVLLAICVAVSVGWLAVGAAVAVATYSPTVAAGLDTLAARGNKWAQGVLAATPRSEPLGQAVLDYGFSTLNLVIAWLLLFLGMRTWVTLLLAVAMIGSAGAFNLQAHAAAVAVQTATGLDIGGLHQVVLHGVSCAAYVVALLLLPTGRWEIGPSAGMGRWALLTAGVGTLLVVGVGTALLPHTVSCILFFGFAVPLAGLIVLPGRIQHAATGELRTQARLLFSVLLAAFGTCVVLGLLTLVLWYLDEPGLVLVDPTVHGSASGVPPAGQPTALLFWFSRLSAIGIGAAVLVAIRGGGLWKAERVFSRGLASLTVVVLVGGGYVVMHAVAWWLPGTETGGGAVGAAALATVLAALTFLPVYLRAERVVDRLLYGRRPTPYRVLADVTALSRTGSAEGPNLTRVAEAIGQGLGARSCRLTVLRPGLRDRTYAWSDGAPGVGTEDQVVLPIRQGTERIGAIAVDRGAVAGLYSERRTLLEDVADSLGAILQASRLGIELERQLRAALAHAQDIAVSRRQAVAEMDNERRMIERDLHDGAQHHLVSLGLALGLVEHEVGSGKFEQARARLDQLANQISMAEAVLAKTASGVSSIALAESGLAAALTADLAGAEPPIAVHLDDEVTHRRFGTEVEEAVYFCCLESVNNARKHAAGAPIAVRLQTADGRLWFSVRDEGPGFDPAANVGSPGRGMRNVGARILAVGGQITVDSAPGAGTTVHGSVPLPADAAVAPSGGPARPAAQPAAGAAPAPRPSRPSRPSQPAAARTPGAAAVPTAPGAAPAPRPSRPAPASPAPPPTAAQASPPSPHLTAPPASRAGRPTVAANPAPSTATPQPSSAPPYAAANAVPPTAPAGQTRPTAQAQPGAVADPHPCPPAPAADHPSPATAPSQVSNGSWPLLDEARALVRIAAEVYPDGPERDQLDELTSGLDTPLRVAVLGSAGAGRSTLLSALRQQPGPPELDLVSGAHSDTPDTAPVDIVLLLIRGPGDQIPGPPPGPTIGVLTRADECGGGGPDALEVAQQLAEEYCGNPELPDLCQTVIPVAALLAAAGAALSQDDFRSLRELATRSSERPDDEVTPALLDRLGRFGVRAAVELIRDGTAPTPDQLTAELVRLSGLPRLREVLVWRVARPRDALKVRAVLHGLEHLVRASGRVRPGLDQLLYQMERLRYGTHELVEIDLADALRNRTLRLPRTDQQVAERLLGAGGAEPAARLGLASDADPEAIHAAASRQLAHWQRLASHPATTSMVRDAAEVLARTCEELLLRPTR